MTRLRAAMEARTKEQTRLYVTRARLFATLSKVLVHFVDLLMGVTSNYCYVSSHDGSMAVYQLLSCCYGRRAEHLTPVRTPD